MRPSVYRPAESVCRRIWLLSSVVALGGRSAGEIGPLSRRCKPEIYRENIKSQFITQTCPCNILQVLLMVKNDNFQFKFSIFFFFFFCSKHRMRVHVRTRTHNLFKKSIMNKHKVKHHRNSDTKTPNRDHIRTTALERSVMNYWGLKQFLRAQPHPP